MTTEPVPTPYDNPTQLWERVSFPSLAVAYRQGYNDALARREDTP